MKHLGRRLLALALSVAMAATMAPPVSAQAASKKTVTVSTQAGLTKALQTKGVTKIIVKTTKAVKFTVKEGKYSAKLDVNAPKATMTNNGTWSAVTVTDAKTYTEKAKNNKIVVKDKKLTFTVAKDASVKSVTFAKKGASDTVKINGKVSAITISAPSTIKITDNGSLKKLTVDAKAKLTLSGSSDTKTAVTLTKNAVNSTVKSAVPVTLKTSATAAVTLSKGAEGSAVTVKSADAKVTLTNNTKKVITVTKADGEKETVKAGEKASTDASDDSTTKDETQKEDDKKPAAGGGGGGASTGSGDTPSTPTDTNPSLTLNKTTATLSKWENDGNLTLVATKKNISGGVEWISSVPGVATVDENGLVSYVTNGSATITASAGGIQAKCTVTVTDEVLSVSGFTKAVTETVAGGTVTLGSDITGDVSLTWGPSAAGQTLTIDMKNYTLTGSMTFAEKSGNETAYNLILKDNGDQNIGAKITGNLTVNAPHAHVENEIWVQGNTTITAVSDSTYKVKDKEKKILLNGPGKLDIQAAKSIAPQVVVLTDKPVTLAGNVTEVSVEKAADITVDAGTTVEKIEVQNTAATGDNSVTVKGDGAVTSLEAKAPVEVAVKTTELTAAAPIVVSGTATISNIYVEDNKATINVDSEAKVDSLSVNSSAVDEVKIIGSGEVKTVDVTKANESITISVDQGIADNVKDVIATDVQSSNIAQGNTIKDKVKTPKSIRIGNGPAKINYYVGEMPVIASASIKIVYSDDSESEEIAVTDKMIDISAVDSDQAGEYKITVSYAGLDPVELATLTYVDDTIVDAKYAEDSMKKLTYTRKDKLDPTGAVITLTYASGKKEQVTDTSKMTFTDSEGNVISNVSPATKGQYVIKVKYGNMDAGSQTVKVNPIYYTVTLNANENVNAPGRKETAQIEEFTTLNQLSASGTIKLTATPTYTAYENRMWTFVKWVRVEDDSNAAYNWDSSVESNLNLIGWWDVKYPEKDKITISVSGSEVSQGAIYNVNEKSVHDFLKTVVGTSAHGGQVLVKYGVSGTNGDNMTAYDPNTSVFEAGKKYEIVYYTKDGATYDGGWASIFIVPQSADVTFADASNGIITNRDGLIRAAYGVTTSYANVKDIVISPVLTAVPDGVNVADCSVACVARNDQSIYVQIHREGSYLLPGTYTLNVTSRLLDANGVELAVDTKKVKYTFDHTFYSSEDSNWGLKLNGDCSAEVLSMPYDSAKSTMAGYVTATMETGSTLAYRDSTDSNGVFKQVSSLSEIPVELGTGYTIRVTNASGESAYFIFRTYDEATSLNVNMSFYSENISITSNDEGSPQTVSAIVQVTSSKAGTYSWLVSKTNLGDRLTIDEYNGYVTAYEENTADSPVIDVLDTPAAIAANTLTDAPVSFEVENGATGTYYIYLIVHADNGVYSYALGDKHYIQIEDGALVTANNG